jgi:release factor glutamine methyltransferase
LPSDEAPPPNPNQKKDRWTLIEVLRWTTARFDERKLASPRLDAEVLIAAALALPRVQLYVQFERPLEAAELATIREHVRRRQAGESVAYIVGHKEFFGLDFSVDARVLVPRPDTETLVDEALARLRERRGIDLHGGSFDAEIAAPADDAGADSGDASVVQDAAAGVDPGVSPGEVAPPSTALPPLRIADIGTGSGAIIVTLGRQHPDAALFAVDSSPGALEVARANALRHNVAVTFLQGDLVAPLADQSPFDLIAANLPYVPSADIAGLAPEVRSEPLSALDGGGDGLDLVRRLVATASPLLAPGGALVLEIGIDQATATIQLCDSAGFVDVRARRDLGSIDRVISAVKP